MNDAPPPLTSQDIENRVLYRDALMLVLDKPPGIPVHAGPNGGASLEDYFPHLSFGYKETPRLAHRLDRDTSGCLILGRNDRALRKLGKLFEAGRIQKTYWAFVNGRPPEESGTIDMALIKVKLQKGWSMRPARAHETGAQTAVTDYKIVRRLRNDRTWLELRPHTGRTHQIRVHLAALGCPIAGDWLYAEGNERPPAGAFPMLHLHARQVDVPLYPNEAAVSVCAEMPQHMADTLD